MFRLAYNFQKFISTYLFGENMMRNRIVPGEFMSATQKSWRGLGSEAVAWHETKARRAARRRMEEEDAI